MSRYTCQSLLGSPKDGPIVAELEQMYPESSLDCFFIEAEYNHDLDPTYILDWLESKGVRFTEDDYRRLMYWVFYKRDRTPSFLVYTWAYDRYKTPYYGEGDKPTCDITFFLFIVLEASKRKDMNLMDTLKNVVMSEDDFKLFIDHMLTNRGWSYFVPWFKERYDIDMIQVNHRSSEIFKVIENHRKAWGGDLIAEIKTILGSQS